MCVLSSVHVDSISESVIYKFQLVYYAQMTIDFFLFTPIIGINRSDQFVRDQTSGLFAYILYKDFVYYSRNLAYLFYENYT